jgi:putative PEP-CTERM system histidine kinase
MTPPAYLNIVGATGYLLAALLMLLLGILLATTWRGRMQGGLLLVAILFHALWAGVLAVQVSWQSVPVQVIWWLEALRDLAWLLFLFRMLAQLPGGNRRGLRLLRLGVVVAALSLLLPLGAGVRLIETLTGVGVIDPRLLIQVLLAVCGLFLVEQIYRSTPWQHRWGIKFLCLGLGSMFAFDFYFFSDALLFTRVDRGLWLTRGVVSAVIVPLLGVSVARNPQWSFDLAVSRTVVFHSTALAAAGVYLLFMALAGYYIRYYGGEWSAVFQPLFLFGAGLLLVIMLFSGHLRSRLKLFVSRHFYSYRYDYREEWLHLISILSGKVLRASLPERIIFALGELVDSPAGCIWIRDDDRLCRLRRCWNLPESEVDRAWPDRAFCNELEQAPHVIDIETGSVGGEDASAVPLPEWMRGDQRLWLLVPLLHEEQLVGFVVLTKPRAPQPLDWQNLELLRTAARQAASYLAFEEAARALADAQQFDGFNRLSAFVVHDLKNLVAQLSLVTRNAERHRDNPAFVDDALQTVSNAVERMTRLLAQLRAATPSGANDRVDLSDLLRQLVREHAARAPEPRLVEDDDAGLTVDADRDRLGASIGNLIQNAQDATHKDGSVIVRLSRDPPWIRVEIADTGCGMDEAFVRERLFRPFDSTKGLAGMGIGAYECRELVNLLGGRVEVDSTPGVGTTFRLLLPAAEGPPLDSTVTAATR